MHRDADILPRFLVHVLVPPPPSLTESTWLYNSAAALAWTTIRTIAKDRASLVQDTVTASKCEARMALIRECDAKPRGLANQLERRHSAFGG